MSNISLSAKAESYLGTAGRPNTFTRWYAKGHGNAYLNAAWCAMFLSYCGQNLGISNKIGNFAYCPYWVAWFKKNKRWGTIPKVDAIVFYSWDGDKIADHVGVVEAIKPKSIITIEGNTGGFPGSVKRMERDNKYILGYGYMPSIISVKPKIHTVQAGDTLIAIAKHYYSDGSKWRTIYNTNKKLIGPDPAMIKPRMKLILP